MKNNAFTIMKKELARFFGDRRLVITTLVLPGLMIYLVYSFIGASVNNMLNSNPKSIVYTLNAPTSAQILTKDATIELCAISDDEMNSIKEKIINKQSDLLVIFPKNFDESIATYEASSGAAPNIEIYYNSTYNHSQSAFSTVEMLLNAYEDSIANKFDINNISSGTTYNLATEKDTTGQVLSSMLPMLMMMFMFSGCMVIAPESIAGEKERGTIATLLVTPIKRSELASGKIISLSVIGLLSGLSSFIGTMLALPKIMGPNAADLNTMVYSTQEFILLILIIFSTVLFLISIISIISAFAKTVKEATTAVAPLMIIVMLLGITSMFDSSTKQDMYLYTIPLYNSSQSISGILSFTYSTTNVLLAVACNIIYTIICGFILAKMFNNERVMFSR